MTRLTRMQRVAHIAEKSEQISRRDVALAGRELDAARSSLASVWLQCEEIANNTEDIPLAFGRALLENGWLLAEQRETLVDAAEDRLEARRLAWSEQRHRVDALLRLVTRLRDAEIDDRMKREQHDLDDIVSSRFAASGRREPALIAASA